MTNNSWDSLIGVKVNKAFINADKTIVVLVTDTGPFYLSWVGDCCSQCYLANVEGTASLVGGVISKVEHAEWKDVSRAGNWEVIESMGSKIETDKGTITFETRLDHNGFYSGWINVSKDSPLNQYGCNNSMGLVDMKPIEDF